MWTLPFMEPWGEACGVRENLSNLEHASVHVPKCLGGLGCNRVCIPYNMGRGVDVHWHTQP